LASRWFNKPVGLLVVVLLLASFLSISGTALPALTNSKNSSVQTPTPEAPLDSKPAGAVFTQAAPDKVITTPGTTPSQSSSLTVSGTADLAFTTAMATTAGTSTPAATTPLTAQPLPNGPLTLIRLQTAEGETNLVARLLPLETVKAGRLTPVDYLPASEGQPEQILALVPENEAALFSNLPGLKYALLDQAAETVNYFWLKFPAEPAPAGETWLDKSWKVLDQTSSRVYFKGVLPLYLGFGFRSKLYVHKAPPRIQIPGLTQPCPCPALAEATYAGMALAAKPAAPNLTVGELKTRLGQVTEVRLRQVVDQISKNEVPGKGALNTRYTGTAGSLYAAERLFNYFFALGLNVEYDSFLEGGLGTVASNVVANHVPADPAKNVKPVILIGHYDSLGERNLNGTSNPKIPAYGANDNGVGIAGLLEVARLLSGFQFARPIRYIAFGAEEQGMLGSQNYTRYSIKPASSTAVINIDSFGYNPDAEDWMVLGFINHGAGLKDSILSYRDKYQINLRLEVKRGEPFFRSDDFYFDQTQHNAVVLTDSYNLQSPNNHTIKDTLENVNFTTTRKVIQLTMATVAEQAGLGG
jgi:hypothetical protein